MARDYVLHSIESPRIPSEVAAAGRNLGLVNCAISSRNLESPVIGDFVQTERKQRFEKSKFLDFIYDSAPVVGFRVMKNDVVTVRKARFPDELAERLEGAGPRGEIEYLSGKSRRRLALIAGNSETVFRSFLTLSYPESFPCDGKRVKRDLRAILDALRRYCGSLAYLWFLEFQKRGAPHFHFFLDFALPEPLSIMRRTAGRARKECRVNWPSQDWISERWFEIVGSGDEKHLKAGAAWEVVEKPDGAARYVAKESYKTFQKVVPKNYQSVGRFWGTSRGLSPAEGKMVYASKDQMAEIFGKESFDDDGNPYPVLFSGAEKYRKILGTSSDPDSLRSCRNVPFPVELDLSKKITVGSVNGLEMRPLIKRTWQAPISRASSLFTSSEDPSSNVV